MAQKKSKNIFKRIAGQFNDVRKELKRVIWPTRQKLIQTSVVVLVVIGIFIVLLTGISKGTGYILEKVGFYDQVPAQEETTLPEVSPEMDVDITDIEEGVQDQEDIEFPDVENEE